MYKYIIKNDYFVLVFLDNYSFDPSKYVTFQNNLKVIVIISL